MNSTETKYAARLERLKREGKIDGYTFESPTLALSDDCMYTPDFSVVIHGRTAFEHHEVKAMWTERKVGWREDAHIKFKWAMQKFPCNPFVLAALHRDGSWHLEEYNGQSATITPEERAAGRSGVHALVQGRRVSGGQRRNGR